MHFLQGALFLWATGQHLIFNEFMIYMIACNDKGAVQEAAE